MTWSTNNDPTNSFSARSMTDKYLTNQALKENSGLNKLVRNNPERSSSSSSSSNESNKIFSNSFAPVYYSASNNSSKQQSFVSPTNSNSSETSTLSGRITKKNCSVL